MDDEDAVRLRRAVMQLARQLNTSATDEGLTPSQASVLGVVAARGPVGIGEVTRVEHLNPTMASRMISALDDKGLVQRTPDPQDQRTATLVATDEGRAAHARIRTQRAAAVSRAAAQLDPTAHKALLAALPALEQLATLFE